MAIFVVLADKPNKELATKIAKEFPSDHYVLNDSQWLVSADAIARSVAEQLGIRSGKFGRAIVLPTSSSGSGWHSKTLWEWLGQKAQSA